MQNKITSFTNPKIKDLIKLKESSERKKRGLIIVEGYREIKRALESGFLLHELYLCREMLKKEEQREILTTLVLKNTVAIELDSKVYEKVSYGDRQDGLLAVFKPKEYSLNELKASDQSLFLVIEEVEKPGNLGAILRTADAGGVSAVIVCDVKTDIYNPNVIRASLGAIFTVKTLVVSKEEAFKFLKANSMMICATTPHTKLIYTDADLRKRLAVVVGSEQKGLSDFWLNCADLKIAIPMKGKVDSLNVSTSTAIVLYEALRQRSVAP